jgi:hypothetical protein
MCGITAGYGDTRENLIMPKHLFFGIILEMRLFTRLFVAFLLEVCYSYVNERSLTW